MIGRHFMTNFCPTALGVSSQMRQKFTTDIYRLRILSTAMPSRCTEVNTWQKRGGGRLMSPCPLSSHFCWFTLSLTSAVSSHDAVVCRMMAPQRCPGPNSQNLWICYFPWQKGLGRCDKVKGFLMGRLFQISLPV